jgi:hypothetical protein
VDNAPPKIVLTTPQYFLLLLPKDASVLLVPRRPVRALLVLVGASNWNSPLHACAMAVISNLVGVEA